MNKLNIIKELKNIILKTESISATYKKTYTNTKYTLDLIIKEILYFLKSGVSWNMLRSPINKKTLFWHYNRIVKANVFYKLFNHIRSIYIKKIGDNSTLLIDSSVIFNKNGKTKLGRNKFYKNKKATKLSLMTDSNGFPLSVLFMKSNYHDNTVFERYIQDALILMPNQNKTVLADKAYSSHKNYQLLEKNNIKHIIPPRKNMKIAKTYKYDKKIYAQRIKVENIFAILKNYKRINCRYDKYIKTFSGFIYLALSILSINIINK